MIKEIFRTILFGITFGILHSSCGLQKEVVNRIEKNPKENIELPIDYCNVFPDSSDFKKWDKDYNYYEKFLTRDILKTQVGLSFNNNGIQTWWCVPSARTHVQLDTTTMILNKDLVIGEWRITLNRQITYEDSALYNKNKMYRSAKLEYNNKDDDVYLNITPDKFQLFAKKKGKFKRVVNKNYDIESNRFLMLFGLSRAASAIFFVGLDKENRLILNSYYVQERKIKGTYIVYQATMTQMVFKKMQP